MDVTVTVSIDDAAVESVLDAVADERWDFRTADGIARETGLQPETVREILETRDELFRRSSFNSEDGQPLYTLRSRPEKLRERIAGLQSFLAKR